MGRWARWIVGCVLGAIGGVGLGSFAGFFAGLGPCLNVDSGFLWLGMLVGAGVGVAIAAAGRPDPSACNRQDPPIRLDE